MENSHQKLHALMIAYPLQGHVIPSVHLAMKLASMGFTITFVNTQSIHHQLTKSHHHNDGPGAAEDIFAGARKSGLDIRYATVSDGFPLGFDRSLHHDQFMEGLLHVMSAHVDEFVGKLAASEPPVNCLIVDTFYVWSSMICEKYHLVNISFWTEPALVLTVYYHLDLLRINGHFGAIDNREDAIDYVPGVRSIQRKDLASYLQADNTGTVVHRIINEAFENVKKADVIICNTVQELEPDTLLALQKKQPVYAIGPVFPIGFAKSPVATSLWSESDCTEWLSARPSGSVLYISFGSYAHASKQDIWEIAYGLLLSEVSFIWVLRPDIVSSDESEPLPPGFRDQIKGIGLIVPWCCQIEVLSHSSIGGFLTHCGWNSILESIWCCVPIMCFPLLTDQYTNRKLVVDDWGIGINLRDEKSVTREEVSRKIRRLMIGGLADELRKKVREVRKALDSALGPNGSSEKNLNDFIDDVKVKITSNKQ
ncbi:UDP-glycosyltransferase 86A1 [Eucalyptus grandis]|uniref:UDP-glycosyltransferase 86A1 n=1 Tax=Eucalyptus grandis TaxID=71139 RepID=UPI00192EAF45|nr:UDP-glycosyltransferase 86A1 [Eucalyptus grandis]